MNFNPRTPCGVRPHLGVCCLNAPGFQSTHPVWGATRRCYCTRRKGDFNPRTPCGVRPLPLAGDCSASVISIHAPRVGCDNPDFVEPGATGHFNPRTPCGVRPVGHRCSPAVERAFQSTHPVWGATLVSLIRKTIGRNFNPRTPCGVRLYPCRFLRSCTRISIHAPRVGCD